MAARDEALERLLVDCDRVVIVGEPGEASCEALAETALRKGKTSEIVGSADACDLTEGGGSSRPFPFVVLAARSSQTKR